MSKHEVVVCCWLNGHITKENMTKPQEDKLCKNIILGKVVCPACRGNLFIIQGYTVFNTSRKLLSCIDKHITIVSAFSNNMLCFKFGSSDESFINTNGSPVELNILLDTGEILCYHDVEGKMCNKHLSPIDDILLELPRSPGFRTKTRVGDLWDKAGIEPVRTGNYDSDGNYHDSKSNAASKERLRSIRKTRNVPLEKSPGTPMTKPTDTIYNHRPRK